MLEWEGAARKEKFLSIDPLISQIAVSIRHAVVHKQRDSCTAPAKAAEKLMTWRTKIDVPSDGPARGVF
jgi:hypothetical protein